MFRSQLRVIAVLTALAAGVFTSLALAATTKPTLKASDNARLSKTIVVDSRGRTVYVLTPETRHSLLCDSSACLAVWPRVTVKSKSVKLVAGHGVHGKLGLLKRSGGVLQVTLRGLPLYRFAGDSGKGSANGEGIQSFGGTWHSVAADTSPSTPAMTTPTTPSPAPYPTPYPYP